MNLEVNQQRIVLEGEALASYIMRQTAERGSTEIAAQRMRDMLHNITGSEEPSLLPEAPQPPAIHFVANYRSLTEL